MSNSPSHWGHSTQSVHAGEERQKAYKALVEPLVTTATYVFDNTQDLIDFKEAQLWGMQGKRAEYARYGGPTIAACEQRLAALENAQDAVLTASGMSAAMVSLLALLGQDTHLIMTDDSYRRTRLFCQNFLPKFGVAVSVVSTGDLPALANAIQPNTRVIFTEFPTNPYLRLTDLSALAELAKPKGIKTIVDSTFATPINVRPLAYGIDLVVHSATKYLAGHNDVLAGVILGNSDLLASIRQVLWSFGAVADARGVYELLRGLKTLALRVERQNENALTLARFLAQHPQVEQVWYPLLDSHPDYALAQRYLQGGGGVVSFAVKGGLESTSQFIDRVKIPFIAASLGGLESLIEQHVLMSYFDLSPEERSAQGMRENLVRMAVGIEDVQDLIADLDQALGGLA
jgi:cystathionine gamma-synthase